MTQTGGKTARSGLANFLFSGINFFALSKANLEILQSDEGKFQNTLDVLSSLGIISNDYANAISESVKESKKEKFEPVRLLKDGVSLSGPLTDEMATETINAFKDKFKFNGRLVMNSPGGNAISGVRLANMVRKNIENMKVIVDGIAHSAASYVVFEAKQVQMDEGSQVMIHRPTSCGIGNYDELGSKVNSLQKIEDIMLNIYNRKTNVGRDKMAEYMNKETFFSAKELKNLGLDVIETEDTYSNTGDGDINEDDLTSAVNGLGYGKADIGRRNAEDLLKNADETLKQAVGSLN